MKLSEILKDWPEKEIMHEKCTVDEDWASKDGFNSALTSCDREIDREALAEALYKYDEDIAKWENRNKYLHDTYLKRADVIISTMPTWLKPTERK